MAMEIMGKWKWNEIKCIRNLTTILLFSQLQLYGFNVELYANLSDAQQKPNGVAAISIMIRVSVSRAKAKV